MDPCEKPKIAAFDYSPLADCFLMLAKPVQRALVNNGILTTADLAKWRLADLAKLHGIGPSSFPRLEAILAAEGLTFHQNRP